MRKKRQAKDKEVERLIKKHIREMKKVIKDKDRQQAVEEKIRRDVEYENSFKGVLDDLRIWGEVTLEDKVNKGIIGETLLKLPYKVRRKTLDEVIFLIVTAQGLTTKATFPVKLRKEDFQQKGVTYHTIIEHPLIFLNFKGRMNKSRKMDIIAHEVAHFILGHHKILNRVEQRENINEGKADDLAEKWGFKRVYKDYSF
ncbi:MAG: ImmA/IrrE family metallo-endopeptidase [Candidatus Scalinduaceae bacterium]